MTSVFESGLAEQALSAKQAANPTRNQMGPAALVRTFAAKQRK
ncbi:MAG: hypothetical protein ACRD3L_04410 [Terriglobales bacterium]